MASTRSFAYQTGFCIDGNHARCPGQVWSPAHRGYIGCTCRTCQHPQPDTDLDTVLYTEDPEAEEEEEEFFS